MRRLITAAFVSLDGVMQAPGGPEEDPTQGFAYGGWVAPLADEGFNAEIGKLFGEPFDLLLGRKTYEIFAAFWPFAEGGPDDAVAKPFNAATKYVASRKGVDLTWENSIALRDAAADVAKLKQQDGPGLVTQGSADLIQTLLTHDLIDEIRLFVFPIALGKGKKLFDAGAKSAAFKLTSSTTSPNGIVIATYARAGAVQTGDFQTKPPSAAEVARREKLKHEG